MRLPDTESCDLRAVRNLTAQALGPDPEKALDAICRLRRDLDSVERMQVASALDRGCSWARIGRALGVSRQAVHSKYSGRRPEDAPRPLPERRPMLSSRARLAVVIGRTEAAGRRDAVAGTEHLLTGLLQQGEGQAVELLEELGGTVVRLREKLDVLAPSGVSQVSPSGLPLSRRARRALHLAAAYATHAGAREVSDLDLLCALVSDPSANAVHVLRAVGIARDDVMAALRRKATKVAA